MSAKPPFAPYRGADKYIFVSYAHKDAEAVYEVLRLLHERKYRIWFDPGIDVGDNWPQTVAEKLLGAELVLVFLSKNAYVSQNCRREINYAVSQRKKMTVVRLDGEAIPSDMAMQLSVVPKVPRGTAEETAEALSGLLDASLLGDGVSGYEAEPLLLKKKRNPWIAATAVLLVLLAGLSAYILGSRLGWFSPVGIRQETVAAEELGEVTVTAFSDPLSMEILLGSLRSESVYLCGDRLVSDAAAIKYTPEGWTVLGEAVERGPVQKLSSFAGKGITQLALINESLESLDGVEALSELTYLDLSDNPIRDLSPLSSLSALETLQLRYLPAETELAPLTALPRLRQVAVSYDMLDRIEPLVEAGIDVIVRR